MPTSQTSKLLIVDDLPENLLALEALIKGEGRQVYQASSADEALALLLEHEFALAILDVQMPGMNGFELAELMRGTEKTKHIPIVFVSAAGRELNYAFKGYESGAVDFLYKPLDHHAVRSKVAVFVELHRQRKLMACQLDALEQGRREQDALLAELRATQAELQRAVQMRDDFMSIVSHELRTPLNGLILDTQLRQMYMAKGNAAVFSEDKLKAMFDRDERQIRSLIRLIEDMLDVSRIRTGKLSIRPERVHLGGVDTAGALPCRVEAQVYLGTDLQYRVSLDDGTRLTVRMPNSLERPQRFGVGERAALQFENGSASVLLD